MQNIDIDVKSVLRQVKEARSIAQRIVNFTTQWPLDPKVHHGYHDSWYKERPHKLEMLIPVLRAADMALPGFATIDPSLVTATLELRKDLDGYEKDASRKRPHNVLMIAPPGSGKSRFVKQLATALEIPCVIGDLSIGTGYDVLGFVINEARNYKAQDDLPLIFLDEADSNNGLLIPSLLSLLWDGEFSVAGQVLKVGRCIIICAVSDREITNNAKFSNQAKTSPRAAIPKLPDFLSRFNGGAFEIKSVTSDQRKLDKLVIAANLIARRFPSVSAVSIGLLQFLARVPVKHEVRSIEFLINIIPPDALKSWSLVKTFGESHGIPSIDGNLNVRFARLLAEDGFSQNPLRFHIDEKDCRLASELWGDVSRNIEPIQIRVRPGR